jgi:FtsH-binding integral membrane protein
METLTQQPLLTFAAVFMALWLASVVGAWLHRCNPKAEEEEHEDLGIILGATLTLLALIIGFSVSMASTRYDQRKNLEEAEANAIGTEMLRAALLPPTDAANVRNLLGAYLDQRILFYINQDDSRHAQIDQATRELQINLWAAVRGAATEQPTPVMALVVAGMNDVINSQGYTQAAFWNRIPRAVWWLMATIALCSNLLFGYRARDCKAARKLALALPFVVSTAFLLIADIDAPRHGLIKVSAQNLQSLAKSLGR